MNGMDANTGRPLSGTAHLYQSVRDIMRTRIGTRVCRRDYGSRIPEYIDRPIGPAAILDIVSAATEAIDKWEPRLKVDTVTVDSISEGSLTISLKAILVENGKEITLEGIQI